MVARREFLVKREAAIFLQKNWRRKICQDKYMKEKERLRQEREHACTKIQANWRMLMQRRKFVSMRNAMVTIQRFVRGHLKRKRERDAFLKIKSATLLIQARWQFLQHMKKVEEEKRQAMRCHQATTTIQAAWKMMVARREFLVKREAAIILQKNWRRKICQEQYLKEKERLRQEGTCIKIQAIWRMLLLRRKFVSMRNATLTIQRFVRSHQRRQRRRREQEALELMEETKGTMEKAAVVVQAAFRGRVARRRFLVLRRAAVIIQATVRGHQTRMAFRFRLAEKVRTCCCCCCC